MDVYPEDACRSNSMFDNANDTKITGGQFNEAGRDMITNVHLENYIKLLVPEAPPQNLGSPELLRDLRYPRHPWMPRERAKSWYPSRTLKRTQRYHGRPQNLSIYFRETPQRVPMTYMVINSEAGASINTPHAITMIT